MDEFFDIKEKLPDKGKDIVGINQRGETVYCFRCACKNPNCLEWRCPITGSALIISINKWKYKK